MRYLLLTYLLLIALVASSGKRQEAPDWFKLRAQQMADSATYAASLVLDSAHTPHKMYTIVDTIPTSTTKFKLYFRKYSIFGSDTSFSTK